MDTLPFNCFTPGLARLCSFQRMPLPNQQNLSISNSPAKLASAGFCRREDSHSDEVECDFCGIVYGEWDGESPYAVHRVLSEQCPFLTTPSPENAVQNHPRALQARRRLFPADDNEGGEQNNDDPPEAAEGLDTPDDTSSISDSESESEQTSNSNTSDSSFATDKPTEDDVQPLPTPTQPAFKSVLRAPQTNFTFPYQPQVGDYTMLFASRRLKTFSDPGCPECIDWAEEGFVYRQETKDVQCIFCALVLPLHACEPKQMHADQSVHCPRVVLRDVGNISIGEEERIKLKNLQRQLRKKEPQQSYAVHHPQYEEESVRNGTFENWPYNLWGESLQRSAMSEAGFFFTGCADKVKCYSCGVGLYRWQQNSDPWQQHALHMPTCPHLLAVKGQHFIQQAALDAQVLTEADDPTQGSKNHPGSPGSPGPLMTSPPGSLTLDVSAVTAALTTSQYTIQQVRHAVLTYFCHTSRYPTKDILLGTLRAADENFTTVCKQRDALYQQSTVIQQKDSQLQEKDTVINEKDTQLQQTHSQLQQKDSVIQQHVTIVQQHRQELQHRDQLIQHNQQELSHHRAELEAREAELREKGEELERKARQMQYQEQQIESLRAQMAALLADRRQAGAQAAPLQAPPPQEPQNASLAITCDVRCKVCLSAESNTIFQPCQHVTCCSHCAEQLITDKYKCPVCRAPIRNVLPAYIA